MESGVIAKWHKKPGDKVESGEVVMEVSTDKALLEHTALDEGYLRQICVPEGASASINQVIAVFSTDPNEELSLTPEPPKTPDAIVKVAEASSKETVSLPSQPHRVLASPLAKKLAKMKGIDLSQVQGSGPRGRVIVRDLEGKKESLPVSFSKESRFSQEPLSQIRQIISKRLQEAKQTIPHFYLSLEVDASPLVEIRTQLEAVNKKVSYNDLLVRACALSLKVHPEMNVGFNSANGQMIKYQTVDVAVAVSLPQGLITPLIFSADQKNLFQTAQEIRALAEKAKKGQLTPNEYQGGSFTLSNLGMYGITHFQGIINPPQASLLAAGGIRDVPVIREGEVVPGKVITLTLSVDHRLIDGSVAARFMQTVQYHLLNPIVLII